MYFGYMHGWESTFTSRKKLYYLKLLRTQIIQFHFKFKLKLYVNFPMYIVLSGTKVKHHILLYVHNHSVPGYWVCNHLHLIQDSMNFIPKFSTGWKYQVLLKALFLSSCKLSMYKKGKFSRLALKEMYKKSIFLAYVLQIKTRRDSTQWSGR